MATGQRPFNGQNSVEVMHAVMHDTAQSRFPNLTEMPSGLQRIIDHSLQKSAGDRYQLMSALVVDLKGICRDVRVSGIPDGSSIPYTPAKNQKTGWWSGKFGRVLGVFTRRSAEDTKSGHAVRVLHQAFVAGAEQNWQESHRYFCRSKILAADPGSSFYGFRWRIASSLNWHHCVH